MNYNHEYLCNESACTSEYVNIITAFHFSSSDSDPFGLKTAAAIGSSFRPDTTEMLSDSDDNDSIDSDTIFDVPDEDDNE